MRIDLVLQGFHACVEEQALLLVQFDLNAHAVEDLELNPDGHRRRGINCRLDPQIAAVQAENGTRKVSKQLTLYETQADDRGEKHNLPVEQAGRRQVAANKPVNAEIDEWRKRPDVVLVRCQGAQLASDEAAERAERQRGPLPIHQSGYGHEHSAQYPGPAAADCAQQKSRFES